MLPSSAPMFEPSLPAHINPVISGPSDRTTACDTNEGNQDSAPKEAKDGCDCLVNTIPARKEVKDIRNSEFTPILYAWLIISLPSKGCVKMCRNIFAKKSDPSAIWSKAEFIFIDRCYPHVLHNIIVPSWKHALRQTLPPSIPTKTHRQKPLSANLPIIVLKADK